MQQNARKIIYIEFSGVIRNLACHIDEPSNEVVQHLMRETGPEQGWGLI